MISVDIQIRLRQLQLSSESFITNFPASLLETMAEIPANRIASGFKRSSKTVNRIKWASGTIFFSKRAAVIPFIASVETSSTMTSGFTCSLAMVSRPPENRGI
jgi:hypothetical protein